MKSLRLCFLLLTAFAGTSIAQSKFAVVSVNADSVNKNASVIKQFEEIVFEVTDIDRASYKVHQLFTIVSEEGKGILLFRQNSSKYHSLDDVSIKMYNNDGKVIAKYKRKDLFSVALGSGLIDDSKTYYIRLTTPSYPVNVEFEYSFDYRQTVGYPSYDILTPGESVVQSSFTAKVPKDQELRYKAMNINLSPSITEDAKFKYYKWEVKNLPAFEYEEGTAAWGASYPSIWLAPNVFKFDSYEGKFTSWKSYGEWTNNLWKGLDELAAERKEFFRKMVENAGSEREKIKLIYRYMQDNFRYVSIQLGIGGLRPFSAEFTDQKKYGDCKALSNYMKAALKAVGIKSYPALINAGSNQESVNKDFPIDRFNHVILCVPQGKDTVWLECTSKTIDFDVLGSFTENRNALLITEEGGKLVSTPGSKAQENKLDISTTVRLNIDGSGKSSSSFYTTGEYKELMNAIFMEKPDIQKQYIVNGMGFKQPDIFSLTKRKNDFSTVKLDMEIEKIPELAVGSKMFLNPRLYSIWIEKLPKAEKRKWDYYFDHPFVKTDTTVYLLPEGYTLDAFPKTKDKNCGFASYTTKYDFNAEKRTVTSMAKLVLNNYKIPADKYAEVKDFFEQVQMDDNQKIVIKIAD